MGVPVLWQYNFSNYNEKARWALDHKGIAHKRRSLLPGGPRAMQFSLRGTLPVLDLDGERIVDTTAIIAALERSFPERPLYPADPEARAAALALEEFFDEHGGHEVRRALFWELRDNPRYVADFTTVGRGEMTRRWMRFSFPLGWQYIRRRYRFSEADAEAAMTKLHTALDRIESERAGGPFLVGDSFSVADLTAAALMWPLVWPDEFQYPMPEPPASDALAEFADHPAIAWIRGLWREHRPPSAEVS